jgi:regulator of sirC expression with transglutaminase-like and TPR domain
MMPTDENGPMTFARLAADPAARMGALALALAAEFRDVDAAAALAQLDELGAIAMVLGGEYGFAGAREEYDHPDHSMLDRVLEQRRGLPIALSVVYVETARRAGIALDGVGLSGHYVVGQFRRGAAPALLDPFAGGGRTHAPDPSEVRRWGAHETALRMLNNLVGSYPRRNDLGRAIRAAELRLELPLESALQEALELELRSIRARLN